MKAPVFRGLRDSTIQKGNHEEGGCVFIDWVCQVCGVPPLAELEGRLTELGRGLCRLAKELNWKPGAKPAIGARPEHHAVLQMPSPRNPFKRTSQSPAA